MSNEIVPAGDVLESLIIQGDLSKLTPKQRVEYYVKVCSSLDLNPLTRPFDYITLNGKLTLYGNKGASEQLRKNNGISIDKPDVVFQDDWIIVTVVAWDKTGRKDSDIGVVSRKDMRGDFGNALMKAVTKAKRRVTLSICGLGMLDETEIETIPDAKPVVVTDTGEIVQPPEIHSPDELPPTQPKTGNGKRSWPANVIQTVIKKGYAQNSYEAVGMLNLSSYPSDTPLELLLEWADAYRQARERGLEPDAAAKAVNV